MPGAYSAGGGIAQYNRDLFAALAASSLIEEIVVLSRKGGEADCQRVSSKIVQTSTPKTRAAFVIKAIRAASQRPGYDIVFCGHIHLLALAVLASAMAKAKLWLQVHGVEVWHKPSLLVRHVARKCNLVTAVSRFTRTEMIRGWWPYEPTTIRVLPNMVSPTFAPGPKSSELIARYNLQSRRVMLTVSRVSSRDDYKGNDRIINVLPRIIECIPNVTYLVVGDGDGLDDLKRLTLEAGLQRYVIFAGHVEDDELVDHYRTSDVFVMPSTGEGFGIVFLQAAACGLPVVGGCIDGSWDALREGQVGSAIDPRHDTEIVNAVVAALATKRNTSEEAYAAFGIQNFQRHVAELLRSIAPTHHNGISEESER